MDVFGAIKGRRSIRKFKKDPVENEKLNKIIEAGIWAPSAGNLQSWEVVVVKEPELKEKLAAAAYLREFISQAPIVLVICANKRVCSSIYDKRGSELYCIQDAACAGENMLLAAHALGLGSCWIGAFDEELVCEIINIPDLLRPLALFPLGYPDEKPYPPPRDDMGEFVHQEKFH
ncbi:MAG: nitroreductase family protein [Methanobacteriaceae archaeon]|nr:nitroreductase family protein [Methanobacteriaceae archaeon]